ncbi:MAG: TolC family protein [Alphaproteobacteria bacterium]|nr:TolC family protein [Alphaproteobacteria bacterium]
MKIKRKFLKTSPFEKNMKIDIMKDICSLKVHTKYRKDLMFYLWILSALLLLSVLIGCHLGSDYEQPQFFDNQEIEQVLNLKPEKMPLDTSFFDFEDETLTHILILAMQNSPSLRSALVKVRQARSLFKISESDLMPSFDLNAKYNYLNAGKNMGVFSNEDYYQTALDMTWEIDIFGANAKRLEAAKANLKGMIENLKNVHVSLISDMTMAYIKLRTTEWLLKNAKENVMLQKNIYQTVQEQFDAGLVDEVTLNQSKYLLETTRMSIPQLDFQRIEAQNTLALLVGDLPTSLNDILSKQESNLVQKTFSYDLNKLYYLSADVIRLRPDVRVAEEQLISGNALVGAAIADMFPKVSLSGLLGFGTTQFSSLFNNASFETGIMPQISIPLLHFGALKNNVELKKAIKEEYLIAYENSLLVAAEEIHNAINKLKNESKRNQFAQKAYDKMTKVSELNWKKYKQGLIPYADVLDAEQRRLLAQTNMVNSNSALYQGIVQYYKSIGGWGK